MIGFVLFTVWYLIGLVTLVMWWRREIDVTLDVLLVMLFQAWLGPINLLLPLLSWLDSKDIVVFKEKRK